MSTGLIVPFLAKAQYHDWAVDPDMDDPFVVVYATVNGPHPSPSILIIF